jgi:hypothetical protein
LIQSTTSSGTAAGYAALDTNGTPFGGFFPSLSRVTRRAGT